MHGRRHNDQSHSREGRYGDNSRTHVDQQGKAFDIRCFNCGIPNFMLIICLDPRNEELILSNLEAWRKFRNLNKPLISINLGDIGNSSFTITKALSTEIFLEHVENNKPTDQSYLASTYQTHDIAQVDFDQTNSHDDSSIFWYSSSVDHGQDNTSCAQHHYCPADQQQGTEYRNFAQHQVNVSKHPAVTEPDSPSHNSDRHQNTPRCNSMPKVLRECSTSPLLRSSRTTNIQNIMSDTKRHSRASNRGSLILLT